MEMASGTAKRRYRKTGIHFIKKMALVPQRNFTTELGRQTNGLPEKRRKKEKSGLDHNFLQSVPEK